MTKKIYVEKSITCPQINIYEEVTATIEIAPITVLKEETFEIPVNPITILTPTMCKGNIAPLKVKKDGCIRD
jgi:hypothetical protein